MSRWKAMLFDGSGDEPETVSGYSAEEAALEYAEKNYADWDYPDEMEIHVRKKSGKTKWQKFNITIGTVPCFSATELHT